uniref:BZIP domain-containing protein n=1 Tax=Anopheles atroparvus TaxID=41427 RepID=A0A182IX64_ANOAO
MSARIQPEQEVQHEIPDPIVVFHYRNSPPRQHDSTIDHQVRLSLDWSRLQREAAAAAHRAENSYSPDANTTTTSEDTSADGSRLQIAWESEHSETLSHQSECSESSETMVSSSVASRASSGSSGKKTKLPRTIIGRRSATRRWTNLLASQNVEIPMVYHRNMARQFPAHERTPAQLEQRRRNTVAARLSRAKMKMAEILMEQEQEDVNAENISVKRAVAAKLVYANALRSLLELPSIQLTDFNRSSPISDEP